MGLSHVICVNVGNVYPPEYVHRLWAGVKRHTTGGLRFTVFTDRPSLYRDHDYVDVSLFMSRGVPGGSVRGRWGRTMIFSPSMEYELPCEPHLYIDVDNVILSDLGPLLEQIKGHEFSAHRPFMRDDGLAAGVLGITPGSDSSAAIWDYYHARKDDYREALTQNLYQYALEEAGLYDKVSWLSRKQVASYKWLAGINTPTPEWLGTWDEAIVLCLHGHPKPPDIISGKLPEWERVKENWS